MPGFNRYKNNNLQKLWDTKYKEEHCTTKDEKFSWIPYKPIFH